MPKRGNGSAVMTPDGFTQDVADAAHRLDQPRLTVGLQGPSQVADEDFEDVGIAEEVVAPDAGHDRGPRQHLLRMPQEEGQQIELAGGEMAYRARPGARCGR